MPEPIRVTVWGENVHERKNPIVAEVYPAGMHACIAEGLREDAAIVMVKERTPSFPAQRCSEMLSHYDEVLEQLKMLEQQGGPRMGPGGPAQRRGRCAGGVRASPPEGRQ